MLHLVGISKRVEFSESFIWSIFFSGLIDLIFIALLGLPLPPTSERLIQTLVTREGAVAFSALVFAFGIVGALILRLDPMGRLRGVIWYRAKARRIPSLVWDDALAAHFQQWLIAELVDGTRIAGVLVRHSTGGEPREIYLARPELVGYDESGNATHTRIAEAIFLRGDNLKSIRFLTAPTDFEIRSGEAS